MSALQRDTVQTYHLLLRFEIFWSLPGLGADDTMPKLYTGYVLPPLRGLFVAPRKPTAPPWAKFCRPSGAYLLRVENPRLRRGLSFVAPPGLVCCASKPAAPPCG